MKKMISGFDLLIKDNTYSNKVIEDFEKVLGILPEQCKLFLSNYKTGYPSINKEEDTEVYAKIDLHNESYIVESFITLPEVIDRQYSLDRAYGFSGNHRKYKLLPICTSGSSYRVYFINQDNGGIYFLNPNEDMDCEIELRKYKLCDNLDTFIQSFKNDEWNT